MKKTKQTIKLFKEFKRNRSYTKEAKQDAFKLSF